MQSTRALFAELQRRRQFRLHEALDVPGQISWLDLVVRAQTGKLQAGGRGDQYLVPAGRSRHAESISNPEQRRLVLRQSLALEPFGQRILYPTRPFRHAAVCADGDGRAGAADRLRQHRQPAARTGDQPPARDGGAPLGRSQPPSPRATTPDRKFSAHRHCRCSGSAACDSGRGATGSHDSGQQRAAGAGTTRRPRSRFFA